MPGDGADLMLHPTYALVAEMLEKKARKLGINVPSKPYTGGQDQNWTGSLIAGWILTPEGERKLRYEIREEQRANADEWRKWLTLFFVLVGTAFAFLSYRTKQKQPDPCPTNYYRSDSGACVFAHPAVPKGGSQPTLPASKPKAQTTAPRKQP